MFQDCSRLGSALSACPLVPLQPVVNVWLHSTGDASSRAALLLPHILPVLSVVAPCPRGASPVSVRRQTFTTGCLARSTMAAVAMASLVSAAYAQGPPPDRPSKTAIEKPQVVSPAVLPSARTILDRHVAAIGGREAVLSHTSAYFRATLSMPAAGITGTLEAYSAVPNKALVKVSLDGIGQVMEGFDGTHAWSISPMTGPMLQEGKELEDKRLDSDFHGELGHDTRYSSFVTVEQIEFDGRLCYKLRLVRRTGGEDLEFYEVATGLKAGRIATRETHMGAVTSTTIESNYRTFGNLLQPTTVKQQVGPVEQIIQVASIEYDTVQPSMFNMPPEIKALLK